MAIELLAPQTAAGQSASFFVGSGERPQESRPSTVIIHSSVALVAGEYADLQISHDGGTTWQDVYSDGVQQRLSSTNNVLAIYAPGIYRIDKDLTTNEVGVYLANPGNR